MSLTLRTPTFADYEAIAAWIPDAAACVRWAGPGLRFPFVAAVLPELLAVPGAVSLCLSEDQGRPLGFGQFWIKTPGSVHLGRIIVSPHERGRGLGKVLCEFLVAEATRRTGAQSVTLRVYRDNPAALAVYAKLGFEVLESESVGEIIAMALSLARVQSAQQ